MITACEDLSLRCRQENRAAFEELVYYNAVASMNLHRMWAYTALNYFLASRGALIANDYAEKVRECLRRDAGAAGTGTAPDRLRAGKQGDDLRRRMDGKASGGGCRSAGPDMYTDEEITEKAIQNLKRKGIEEGACVDD